MTAPRLGMGMPPDDSWVGRRLDDLQRQLNELRAARTLEAATIGKGGLTIAGGSLVVEDASGNVIDTVDASGITVSGGKLVVDGSGVAESGNYTPGSAGWALQPNGNAEFNNLTLRGGIIGNDALANPITFGSADHAIASINLPNATSVLTSANIAVPAGFTTAAVLVSVPGGCTATASSASGLQAVASVTAPTAVDGDIIAGGPLAGQAMTIPATLAAVLTGLSGGSITVAVKGNYYGTAPAANSGNGHVTALAIFTR